MEKKYTILSYLAISCVVLITLFFAYQIPDTKLNYNFEEFFPADDAESAFFYEHRELFESDNDFILIAIEREKGIFDASFLQKIHALAEEIDTLPNVKFTKDITHEKELFLYGTGFTGKRPYVHLDTNQLKEDSANIYENKELINSLVNKNGTALTIFVKHQDYISKKKGQQLVEDVNTLTKPYDFEQVRMAGRTVGQLYYVDTMVTEMFTYIGFSIFIVIIFLLLTFRSLWGLLVPQIVVVGSMIWIFGFMALIDKPINILLIVLPSIMFVVSMSDVIHLMTKYLELMRLKYSKIDAIKTSFKEIGLATFLTSLTTAIGFFSLLFVNVIPIQEFGLYTGIGVLFAFIIAYGSLPFLFYLTKTPKVLAQKKRDFWRKTLYSAFSFTLRKRKIILILSILIIGAFVYGATLIVANNYIMDDINPKSQIKKDFNYLDSDFGGVRPFEMEIELKDTAATLWNLKRLQELEEVEKYLVDKYKVEIKKSMVRYLNVLNRSSHAGDTNYFSLPNSKRKLKKFKRILKVANKGGLIATVLDSTETITRVNGTVPDWGNKKATQNAQLMAFIQEKNMDKHFDFTITGSAHLLDKNMSYMSTSLVEGLAFALVIVGLIIGVLYRSFRMIFIAMVPNLIPLLVIAGFMGFAGINLKITTAIVFTLSFGIAVDDTIHFLSKFKLEMNKGRGKIRALKNTIVTTGKAIILTSTILIAGFSMLLLSNFMGTFYMGLMVCITLFVAILADLFLLPILLYYFYPEKKKK